MARNYPDLNALQADNDGNYLNESIKDNSITDDSRPVKVYFRNLENRLIHHIEQADVVLGCVAWLTSDPILDALIKTKATSIVVQKEDFLRPDLEKQNNWEANLRRKYDAIKCPLDRYAFGNIIGRLSVLGDPSLNPIRCVGNHNKEKLPAFPRMHNKFLIFAHLSKVHDDSEYVHDTVEPYAVWTGSFNLSKNATKSLENALYITDPEIVNAYFSEYGQIVAISEPLNWSSEWVAPEWRTGT